MDATGMGHRGRELALHLFDLQRIQQRESKFYQRCYIIGQDHEIL